MFICVKLPVLSNAPLCASPKTLQVNKRLQVTRELNLTLPRLAGYSFILHIYNPSCAMLLNNLLLHMCAVATFIYSYIHTSCDVFRPSDWVFIGRVCLHVRQSKLLSSYCCGRLEKAHRLQTNLHIHAEQQWREGKNMLLWWWQNTWIWYQCCTGEATMQCRVLRKHSLADVGRVVGEDETLILSVLQSMCLSND